MLCEAGHLTELGRLIKQRAGDVVLARVMDALPNECTQHEGDVTTRHKLSVAIRGTNTAVRKLFGEYVAHGELGYSLVLFTARSCAIEAT